MTTRSMGMRRPGKQAAGHGAPLRRMRGLVAPTVLAVGAMVLSIALGALQPATAQTTGAPATNAQALASTKRSAPPVLDGATLMALQAERSALFEYLLANPADLDASFRYAALSVRVGDLEAAIQVFQRMLIYAPGMPRLQLELGLLYHRLGANETARQYLQEGITG